LGLVIGPQKEQLLGKVVITGVAGFLGSHLADRFLKEGWEVIGVDNLLGGYMDNIPDGVIFSELDLVHDLDSLEEVSEGADLFIHAACTAYEGLSVFSPSLVVSNTTQATTNALVAAVNAKVKRFVYLSSMARYGDHDGVQFTEDMQTKPQDPYGIAKVASENLVKNLCDTHGIDWVILVPHNIIGARQKYDDPYRNVASIMANRMLQGKQPIIYGDGTQQRCFSFVQDVVNPLFLACQSDEAISQVINVGPDEEPVTINHLAEVLAEIVGLELAPIFMPGRPKEVKIALCSSDKARKILGYQTSTTLEQGLRELVEYITIRGVKDFTYHLPLEIITEQTPKTWSQRIF
jgi:UDP-glucose 4-epimerase